MWESCDNTPANSKAFRLTTDDQPASQQNDRDKIVTIASRKPISSISFVDFPTDIRNFHQSFAGMGKSNSCEYALQNHNHQDERWLTSGLNPRFLVPNWIARPLVGESRFATLPTSCLVDEVQFGGNKHLHKSAKNSFVCAGKLTPYLAPVAGAIAAREVGEIIDADLNYRETEVYRTRLIRFERGIEQKLHARQLETRDDIDEYFAYRASLIRSVMAHGCVSQRKLSAEHRTMVPEFSSKRAPENDIGCAIGPAGETWMFWSGHHRLQIARALGIEQVPVEIHFVHWRWIARICRKYRRAPFATAIAAAIQD